MTYHVPCCFVLFQLKKKNKKRKNLKNPAESTIETEPEKLAVTVFYIPLKKLWWSSWLEDKTRQLPRMLPYTGAATAALVQVCSN